MLLVDGLIYPIVFKSFSVFSDVGFAHFGQAKIVINSSAKDAVKQKIVKDYDDM